MLQIIEIQTQYLLFEACAKYQIENSDIIRHYDVTGKLCPLYYVNNPDKWNRLRNQIKNYILKYKKE